MIGPEIDRKRNSMSNAMSSLCHHSCFENRIIRDNQNVLLGAAFRNDSPPDIYSEKKAGLSVVVYGFPLQAAGIATPVTARQIIDRYHRYGIDSIFQLDGFFVIVVLDEAARTLWVVNDRTGSLPVMFAEKNGSFAFAPEAKAIFPLLDVQPRLDPQALIAFINCGHLIGDGTIFSAVKLLEAAHFLRIKTDTLEVACDSYWDLRFSPAKKTTIRDAVDGLTTAMENAHRAVLADDPMRLQLLLTGGLDSRAILGNLSALGHPPDEVLTWGVTDTLPRSDPELARQMADACGVPFRFLHYDADTFSANAMRWAYTSEMMSDNMGNFAAGADFLYKDMPPAPVVLIGDQMIGPGGFAADFNGAVESITKVPQGGLLPSFEAILKKGRRHAAQSFRNQVNRITSRCGSNDPKDIQDYLFFHLYVFRWLYAPGYFKEPMVTVRRPLMLSQIIDLTMSLPRWLRVDKRVLVHALKSQYPDLMKVPSALAHSLVDWNYEIRRIYELKAFFLDQLGFDQVRSTPLGEILDREKYEGLVNGYFTAEAIPVRRKPRALAHLFFMRRFLSRSPSLGRVAKRMENRMKDWTGWKEGVRTDVVLRRIALIGLMQRCIDEGWFEHRSTSVGPKATKVETV